MSPFKIDMSDVGEGFDPIPAGVYPIVVSSLKQSEEDGPSGYPYIILEMTVADGDFENRKLWTNLSMSPKAAFKVKEFLLATGVPPEDLTATFKFDPDEYEGAVIDISVKQTTYDDKLRNQVSNFIPAADSKTGVKGTAKAKKSALR